MHEIFIVQGKEKPRFQQPRLQNQSLYKSTSCELQAHAISSHNPVHSVFVSCCLRMSAVEMGNNIEKDLKIMKSEGVK